MCGGERDDCAGLRIVTDGTGEARRLKACVDEEGVGNRNKLGRGCVDARS